MAEAVKSVPILKRRHGRINDSAFAPVRRGIGEIEFRDLERFPEHAAGTSVQIGKTGPQGVLPAVEMFIDEIVFQPLKGQIGICEEILIRNQRICPDLVPEEIDHIPVILPVDFHSELPELQIVLLPSGRPAGALHLLLKRPDILLLGYGKRMRQRDQHGILVQNGNGNQSRILRDRHSGIRIDRQKEIPGELLQILPDRLQEHCRQIVGVLCDSGVVGFVRIPGNAGDLPDVEKPRRVQIERIVDSRLLQLCQQIVQSIQTFRPNPVCHISPAAEIHIKMVEADRIVSERTQIPDQQIGLVFFHHGCCKAEIRSPDMKNFFRAAGKAEISILPRKDSSVLSGRSILQKRKIQRGTGLHRQTRPIGPPESAAPERELGRGAPRKLKILLRERKPRNHPDTFSIGTEFHLLKSLFRIRMKNAEEQTDITQFSEIQDLLLPDELTVLPGALRIPPVADVAQVDDRKTAPTSIRIADLHGSDRLLSRRSPRDGVQKEKGGRLPARQIQALPHREP